MSRFPVAFQPPAFASWTVLFPPGDEAPRKDNKAIFVDRCPIEGFVAQAS